MIGLVWSDSLLCRPIQAQPLNPHIWSQLEPTHTCWNSLFEALALAKQVRDMLLILVELIDGVFEEVKLWVLAADGLGDCAPELNQLLLAGLQLFQEWCRELGLLDGLDVLEDGDFIRCEPSGCLGQVADGTLLWRFGLLLRLLDGVLNLILIMLLKQ